VTGGGGLPGAYLENSANASVRRELTHTWGINFNAFYSNNKNQTPLYPFSEPGGHTIRGGVSADHAITRALKFIVGYDKMEENYAGVGALSALPSSNREYGSISYQFSRPIGR
jgi:hypothetical protein